MRQYSVVIEETLSKQYSAYVPDLPGCIATGSSRIQVEINIQEAITFHLEGMLEDNLSPSYAIPEVSSPVFYEASRQVSAVAMA